MDSKGGPLAKSRGSALHERAFPDNIIAQIEKAAVKRVLYGCLHFILLQCNYPQRFPLWRVLSRSAP